MSGKKLVAIDGSPEAYNALVWVIEQAKEKEKVYAVYVISPAKYATIEGAAGYEGIQTLAEIRERIVQEDRDQVTTRVKELSADRNVEVDLIVRTGDPRSVILDTADEIGADLLAVGSTGKGLGARLLLGSVSTYIMTHAKITTVVVR
ncbi:MAG: universal stress protein [Methanospirillum sp.]|nr:universal stress protein [Methanospirillum sp.]